MSADRAFGMVRGWPQLMQSAAELWAVLPPDPAVSGNRDSIGILAAMERAVGRGLAAGYWPGRGPRDEAWEQIASNFVQARRLRQEQPVASEAVSTDGPTEPITARTQIVHALYVAATQPTNRQPVGDGQPYASLLHWPPGRSRPTGHSPTSLIRPIWYGSPGCRRSSPLQLSSSAKPPRDEARLTPA